MAAVKIGVDAETKAQLDDLTNNIETAMGTVTVPTEEVEKGGEVAVSSSEREVPQWQETMDEAATIRQQLQIQLDTMKEDGYGGAHGA